MGDMLVAGFQSRTDRLLGREPLDDDLRRAIVREMRARLRAAHTQPDAYHGMAHATAIARHCLAIARHVGKALDPTFAASELLALEVAALLHDVGYTAYEPSWDANRRQHVKASLDFARRALAEVAYFADHARLTQSIGYLIAHHDDTSYKFPSAVWQGGVGMIELDAYAGPLAEFEASLPSEQRPRLRLLLAILREADALSAAGPQGAARTFGYSVGRGLPVFAQGNPLDAWCWEESAVANTRLAAKRALIDACTVVGLRRARRFYHATEAYIEAICARDGVEYMPEQLAPVLDGGAVNFQLARSFADALEMTRFAAWPQQLQVLQSANGAPGGAVTERQTWLRRLSIAELPEPHLPVHAATLELLQGLENGLQREYALSLFDLTGRIDLRWRGGAHRLHVPVLAQDPRPLSDEHGETIDRDGAARVQLARLRGASAMWVVDLRVASVGG